MLVHQLRVDQLEVKVFADRAQLGATAGKEAAERIKQLLQRQERVRMIFAAAPSQNEFLQTLVQTEGLDWSRVTAFHMDEYIGLPADSPQRFSQFLQDKLFNLVSPGEVHLIDSSNEAEAEGVRYAQLLGEAPIDIVCLGIGENGHIAFNDPPVADFNDPEVIKPVELDSASRQQQVNDGCFSTLEAVPTHALTLTIPALLSAKHLFCMVPGPTKRAAVKSTLYDEISTNCPATILRTHRDCTLYLDEESFGEKS